MVVMVMMVVIMVLILWLVLHDGLFRRGWSMFSL